MLCGHQGDDVLRKFLKAGQIGVGNEVWVKRERERESKNNNTGVADEVMG